MLFSLQNQRFEKSNNAVFTKIEGLKNTKNVFSKTTNSETKNEADLVYTKLLKTPLSVHETPLSVHETHFVYTDQNHMHIYIYVCMYMYIYIYIMPRVANLSTFIYPCIWCLNLSIFFPCLFWLASWNPFTPRGCLNLPTWEIIIYPPKVTIIDQKRWTSWGTSKLCTWMWKQSHLTGVKAL